MSRNVGLIYQSNLDSFSYGEKHPMKPLRVAMTYELL